MAGTVSDGGLQEAITWLRQFGLDEEKLPTEDRIRRYKALSKCQFGQGISDEDRRRFLKELIPHERNLAAYQTDIGRVDDPKYHYKLTLRNEAPIRSKPIRLRPEEEAWLDAHIDDLLAKGVITPILPHEQPRCVTPLLLVPGQQSGQAYRVVQNIVPVNKRTDEYQYQLNDTRRYRARLGRARWVSMLDMKAGFYNIVFEESSSYDSTFVTHRGKFRWLKMTMGLTQAPAHFQFVVEDVLKGSSGDRPLPVVVYLDDIAVYGDDQGQVLEDTLEAIRRLTKAGFMINLSKSHLVESAAKVLGHQWSQGGFWAPTTTKLEALLSASSRELERMNRSSLYGLLNFFREYVPTFAERTEPLRALLGQDAKPWTQDAETAVREVAGRIISSPRWMNMEAEDEVRVETRIVRDGLAILLLQRNPEKRNQWLPIASWGRCLDAMEVEESRVLLEAKALREGCWKLGEYTSFTNNLTMCVSKELRALLKIAAKANPQLQAILIDIMQYRPKFLVGASRVAPKELGMEDDIAELGDDLSHMKIAEDALRKPIHLPSKARFTKGEAIHVQFDGGSQDGHGTGGFVILDSKGNEVIRAGRYYGPGRTNNEAEAFAMRDAVQCLSRLKKRNPGLDHPVRVFGDSQLMIRFITRLYKRPTRHTIYWALEDTRRAEQFIRQPVAYRHVTREANQVADDMARRALEEKCDVLFWYGDFPPDAPTNQIPQVYEQQEPQEHLDWSRLPEPMQLPEVVPETPSVSSVFGSWVSGAVDALAAVQERRSAIERLGELTSLTADDCQCYATSATGTLGPPPLRTVADGREMFSQEGAIYAASGQPVDNRPCLHCGSDQHQDAMILCDRCESCFHKDCAPHSQGSCIHDGPWFCGPCKGHLTLHGFDDVTHDWPLIDHLWTGWLPEDPDEADRIQGLAQHYRASGNELQVKLPPSETDGYRWVDVPPLVTRPTLIADHHASLGHCGRDKLLGALRDHYWWPGMHVDIAEGVRRSEVNQKDNPIPPPSEVIRWIEKGDVPFAGWSLDAAGPFPEDEDGNRYLLVAIDPFSKWVEAAAVPSLHSWRAADFLYERIVTFWGKPRFIRTDNGSEFQGSLHRLCKALGIAHNRITVGNSKANGQVERTIRTLKEVIRRGLTRDPASFWSNHLGPALAMLRFTPHRATGLSPFSLITGRTPQLPSLPCRPLPSWTGETSASQEESYFDAFAERTKVLAEIAGRRIVDMERRIREASRRKEKGQVHPTLLFHFEPGQLVVRRHRTFSKLDPRTTGPFIVKNISGVYRQRITIQPVEGIKSKKKMTVHASQLVPFEQPYIEPSVIDLGREDDVEVEQNDRPRTRQKRGRASSLNVWEIAEGLN